MVTKKILSYLSGLGKPASKKTITKSTRQHRRLKAFNLIKFTLSDGTQYESISNIVDISETGLQFTCYEELQPDQNIRMLIHIPHANEDIPLQAKLVWVRRMQYPKGVYVAGVQFLTVSDHHRDLIREMIEKGRYRR